MGPPSAAPESHDPLLGQVLEGRYRVVKLLGEGAMGRVYEGVHVQLDQRVAIKVLHPEIKRMPVVLERFRREARAASKAGNEHIVQVFDLGKLDNGDPFMVLELLDGRDLESVLQQELQRGRWLPLERVASIATQICDALSAAHAHGIVHRDLKPSNVLLIARGENPDFVKVLDFGVSKLGSELADQKLTQTGVIIGTPLYMSPEQVQGRSDVDHRADIFALGAMLYHALCGHPPFERDGLHALLHAISSADPVPLHELRPDLPRAVCDAIMRALAKSPAARQRDCAELRLAFAAYRAPSTLPPPLDVPALSIPARRRIHPGWMWGTALLIAGTLALWVWWPWAVPQPRAHGLPAGQPTRVTPVAPPQPDAPESVANTGTPIGIDPIVIGRDAPPPRPQRRARPDEQSSAEEPATGAARPTAPALAPEAPQPAAPSAAAPEVESEAASGPSTGEALPTLQLKRVRADSR